MASQSPWQTAHQQNWHQPWSLATELLPATGAALCWKREDGLIGRCYPPLRSAGDTEQSCIQALSSGCCHYCSTPRKRDLAFGASCGQDGTSGLNNCGFLPVFNLHPLGSPVSCPASLQQAEASTCYVNLICSHTRLILSTSRGSYVRIVQLKFGLDHVSLHMIKLEPV